MKRKILYISGSRADYGLMRSVLSRIHHHPEMELHIAVTGMHLMEQFGLTVNEIRRDGYTCHILNVVQQDDTRDAMAVWIGQFLKKLVPAIRSIQPDLILLLGDRGEMLCGAIAGTYMGIPVAHIHGGEVTATPDEFARHAITKLSHVHLAATKESVQRIIRMGENPQNVYQVGAPGLDQIQEIQKNPDRGFLDRYSIDPAIPLILVLQHPVPLEPDDPADQIKETLKAAGDSGGQVFVIYPNADAGGRAMIREIERQAKRKDFRIFPSMDHMDFLQLLKNSSVIVGNSSSGIIEAPSFGVPAVNIGTRQQGRQQGANVINTGYDSREIALAIERAIKDVVFKKKVKNTKNPYGDGKSGERIVGILEKIEITPQLLQKRMMY